MGINTTRKVVDNSKRKKHFFPEPGMRIDLGTLLEQQVDKYQDKLFLTFIDTDERYTYNKFNAMVNRIAHGLSELGIAKGDYVAIMLPNCCENLFVCYSLYKLGAPEVTINRDFRGVALSRMINMTGTKYLVSDKSYIDALVDITDNLNQLETIIFINDADKAKEKLSRFNVLDYQSIISENRTNPPSIIDDDTEMAMVMPTSGTTGLSKGCMLSHRACIRVAENTMLFLEVSEKDIVYTMYPLFHVGPRLYDILPTLMAGGGVVLRSKFSLSNFWPEIVKHNCTFFLCLGSVQALLYNADPRPEETQHNLRIVWAAPTTIQKELWEERFKVELITRGGYSETGVGSVVAPQRGHDGGIVRAIYDVRVVDENDEELPDGEIGEIVIRPLEPDIMFKGYFGVPEATLKAWRNLWHHTGDLGCYDEEGYFYFLGRMSERIRVRGELVSAVEVEEVFLKHPYVADCAAIGVPCELGEDDVKLYVQLRPEVNVSKENLVKELLEYSKDNMSKYMAPKYIAFVGEFTRTPSGKIKKDILIKIHEDGVA